MENDGSCMGRKLLQLLTRRVIPLLALAVVMLGCGIRQTHEGRGSGTGSLGQAIKNEAVLVADSIRLERTPDGSPTVEGGSEGLRLGSFHLSSRLIEGPLANCSNAIDMATFFHAGRSSDIKWAGFDSRTMTLYVVGLEGAIKSMVESFPRVIAAIDMQSLDKSRSDEKF